MSIDRASDFPPCPIVFIRVYAADMSKPSTGTHCLDMMWALADPAIHGTRVGHWPE
jgi:hypothetical protein